MEELKIEINPDMNSTELWIELKIALGDKAPCKASMFQWLRCLSLIPESQRGGYKQKYIFKQVHLEILIEFAALIKEYGTLKAAKQALLEKYLEDSNND